MRSLCYERLSRNFRFDLQPPGREHLTTTACKVPRPSFACRTVPADVKKSQSPQSCRFPTNSSDTSPSLASLVTEICSGLRLAYPAVTVVVMNAHLWHGGTANRTSAHRRALHAFYTRWDKPQQQYQKKDRKERRVGKECRL